MWLRSTIREEYFKSYSQGTSNWTGRRKETTGTSAVEVLQLLNCGVVSQVSTETLQPERLQTCVSKDTK